MADFDRELTQLKETVTETHDMSTCCVNFMTAINVLIERYTKTWKMSPKRSSLPWFSQDTWQLMKRNMTLPVTKTNTAHFIYTGLRNKVLKTY